MPALRPAALGLLMLAGAAQAQAQAQAPMPTLMPTGTQPGELPLVVDQVVVRKAARTLTLYAAGRALRTIAGIQLGGAPVGPKRFQGDGRTPEGRYLIDYGNPASAYFLSLHISYPDARDVAFARAQGRSAGGQIFIHGQPNDLPEGRVPGDWTDGCIALGNDEMEALWAEVPDGTVIDILP